jgi:uncharacterized protein (TIGR02996 family)
VSLGAALAALVGGDEVTALTALLAAWRDCPAPRIATLITTVSDRLRGRQEALFKRRAWLAVEREHKEADLGRLLATLEAGRWSARQDLPLLLARPSDPRLIPLVTRWRDPSLALGRACARWLDALPPLREVSSEELALLARIEGVLKKTVVSGEDLLAEIYRHPEDPGLRFVYCDWLVERGDPRGELLTLQLRRAEGQGTPEELRRERELLRSYRKDWLGGIAPVVGKTLRFERGFLVACEVGDSAAVTEAIGRPDWATVEELRLYGSHVRLAQLAGDPVMRSLRQLGARAEVLAALVTGEVVPPLRVIELFPSSRAVTDVASERILRETGRLPSVETMRLGGAEEEWVARSRFFAQVRRLVIMGSSHELPGWILELLRPPGPLTWIGLSPARYHDLAFTREADALWTLTMRRYPEEYVRALLERVPTGTLGRVVLTIRSPALDRLIRARHPRVELTPS